ncbi:MAG: hypothetical protein EPO28_08685 [Saprospiraceae bacterium]|nr:MAG: hypothetical protein EPO28_08685 [Saprospiraceae bacterium]
MLPLDKEYLDEVEAIAKSIQESEELAAYLQEEEDEYYERMKEVFEPSIQAVHTRVANENPLQLISLERRLMQEDFEGLGLPRMLGYSVMRGEFDSDYKYVRPQDHFKDLVLAICQSANFELLKKRIGQSIQIGLALSSDIWITNLIATIENKKIRYFLQSQKLDKYRSCEGRAEGYRIFSRQFRQFNYMTADFPHTVGELKVMWSSLKEFLLYRLERKLDNTSLLPFMKEFIENEEFQGQDEHLQVMGIYASFFDLNEDDLLHLVQNFSKTREKHPDFIQSWFEFILELHKSDRVPVDAYADARIFNILDPAINDKMSEYYNLMATIHSMGYTQEETMETVKTFYSQHEGRSLVNECVRMSIKHYFDQLLNNLEATDYQELFESAKIYTVYIRIFNNQQFNLDIKRLSMRYIKLLLKKYTDKRGKDYQDIKKFVSATFLDLKFLNEKELEELFKTRRKKKPQPG